jgi:hypothetical protein
MKQVQKYDPSLSQMDEMRTDKLLNAPSVKTSDYAKLLPQFGKAAPSSQLSQTIQRSYFCTGRQ